MPSSIIPQQPTNHKKRFPGEGELFSLFLSPWSERKRRVPPRQTNPWVVHFEQENESKRDLWDTYAILWPDNSLARTHFKHPSLFICLIWLRRTKETHGDATKKQTNRDNERDWPTSSSSSSGVRARREKVEIRKHDIWLVFWWFFLDLERL